MRVVIAEDHGLMRAGLELLLERAGHEVVASVADADELRRRVRAHAPDLVLTDIRMPPGLRDEGLQAALELRAEQPDLPVLILSQHVQRRYASELLEAGAAGVGYLLKQRVADTESFERDLRRVAEGGTVLDPEVASMLVSRASHDDEAVSELTARQREVLSLMAEGRSNAAIADRLHVSEKAVVAHTSRIYDQLGLSPGGEDHRRVLAVVRYLASASG